MSVDSRDEARARRLSVKLQARTTAMMSRIAGLHAKRFATAQELDDKRLRRRAVVGRPPSWPGVGVSEVAPRLIRHSSHAARKAVCS
jgi:hypothetical protein